MSSTLGNLQCTITTLLLILAAFASQTTPRSLPNTSGSKIASHNDWMIRYGRVYKDDVEKETRAKIYLENVKYIDAFNKGGNKPYKLAVNQFADQTKEEFAAYRTGLKRPINSASNRRTPFKYENVASVPVSIDWREYGAVTDVKDQGPCGSCWAFSAIGAVEGITQISSRWSISLSEQELVDCDRHGTDEGCMGGFMENAFKFIIQNGGITSTDDYPYKASDGTCQTTKASNHVARISGYENVPENSEASLMKAVANQPVSVAVAADGDFMFYSSGIYNGTCSTELDHGVTAVGYGVSESGIKYWLVKNSWGTSWGDEGYMKIAKDVDAKEGKCGIAMDASYPTV